MTSSARPPPRFFFVVSCSLSLVWREAVGTDDIVEEWRREVAADGHWATSAVAPRPAVARGADGVVGR